MRKPGNNCSEENNIAELLFDNRDRLHRYLRARLKSDADAQELSQEAYLRLLRVSRKKLIKHPQTYLFRIAANLVYELYNAILPVEKRADEKELMGLEASDPAPDEMLARQRQLQQVEAALRELPPKCRAVVTMRSRQGMTSREVAARLGVSTEMVKKYMATGIAHCRKRLSRYREEQS